MRPLAHVRGGFSQQGGHRPRSFFSRRVALAGVAALLMSAAQAGAQHHIVLPGASGLPHGIPDFCETPTVTSVRSGAWSDPGTWSTGSVPAGGAKVAVAAGHQVSYALSSTVALNCLDIYGHLKFATTVNTRLRVGTVMVMAGGHLEIGSVTEPVVAGSSAELSITDTPVVPASDPDGFGTGLIGIGRVTMHGAPLSPTFVRLAAEPLAGQTMLTLAQPTSGWRVGDEVVIPDTRHLMENERFSQLDPRAERALIVSISGTRLDLDRPLAYHHRGARNASGVVEYLPHVGNASRNVRIRSENPSGTRGHTLYTDRAEVDIRYVAFKDLARTTNAALGSTNLIGRYPLHIHHVMGPVNPTNTGYQFRLIGNAVIDSRKWPITIHNSHYGLIQDNVVAFGDGAGYVTEDGNESYNEFKHNFGMAITGDVEPRDQDGRGGSIFWFAGFNHLVSDNVAASGYNRIQSVSAGAGFDFSWHASSSANAKIPTFRGSDLTAPGSYQTVNNQHMNIPRFERNEAYGAMGLGLTIWTLGTSGYDFNPTQAESLIRDFTAWHVWSSGFYGYPLHHVTFDGFIYRGDPAALYSTGWTAGDYKARDITIRRANIQGAQQAGIFASSGGEGYFRVEDSVLQNAGPNLVLPSMATFGTGAQVGARAATITNVRYAAWPGRPFVTVAKQYMGSNQTNPNTPDTATVFNHNGTAGDNFQLYFTQQATQQVAGGLAPCSGTRPEIQGIVCPVGGSTALPPRAPAAPANVRVLP